MNPPRLVLASTSPYRAALLARLGLPFEVIAPQLEEPKSDDVAPERLAVALARAKAEAVAARLDGGLVIGADQIAAVGGERFGKPGTVEAAVAQLERASGRRMVFYTGVCLQQAPAGRCHTAIARYAVDFRPLSAPEIRRYVERDRPLDCAGSIRAEGLGVTLLERMAGEDPTALVGLPLITLCALLRAAGVAPLTGGPTRVVQSA